VRNLSFVGNAYLSDGGGGYIFSEAPDFVVNPPNRAGAYTISQVKSGSYLVGLELKATPQTALFGYYSGIGIERNAAQQANGSSVDYGYMGSPNTQNKAINELTFGAVQTLWKEPAHGALQIIAQASYADREPWYVAPGAPRGLTSGCFSWTCAMFFHESPLPTGADWRTDLRRKPKKTAGGSRRFLKLRNEQGSGQNVPKIQENHGRVGLVGSARRDEPWLAIGV
jgi:hypothetical protein